MGVVSCGGHSGSEAEGTKRKGTKKAAPKAAPKGKAAPAVKAKAVVAVAVAFLTLVNRDYLAVYDSLGGQVVLGIVGAIFATGGWLLTRMSAIELPDRFTARASSPSLTGAEP